MKNDKKSKLIFMAVPCQRPFIVSKDKSKEFVSSSNTKQENKEMQDMAATFIKNNLVDTGPVLIKKINLRKKQF